MTMDASLYLGDTEVFFDLYRVAIARSGFGVFLAYSQFHLANGNFKSTMKIGLETMEEAALTESRLPRSYEPTIRPVELDTIIFEGNNFED